MKARYRSTVRIRPFGVLYYVMVDVKDNATK